MERTTVDYGKLKDYMRRMFVTGLKYPEESAAITAEVLVEADARGHASHGVARISMYASEVWALYRYGQTSDASVPNRNHAYAVRIPFPPTGFPEQYRPTVSLRTTRASVALLPPSPIPPA